MKLECNCSNYQLAVQVRTNGGILSLDFYCANCYTLKQKKPPFKMEQCFTEKESDPPEAQYIRDEEASLKDWDGIDTEGLKPDVEDIDLPAPPATIDELLDDHADEQQPGINRGDWHLHGSAAEMCPSDEKDRDWPALIKYISKFFNLSLNRLDWVLKASQPAVHAWASGRNRPIRKHRDRINYILGLIDELKRMYGPMEFDYNNQVLRNELQDTIVNKTRVKAQTI